MRKKNKWGGGGGGEGRGRKEKKRVREGNEREREIRKKERVRDEDRKTYWKIVENFPFDLSSVDQVQCLGGVACHVLFKFQRFFVFRY